MCIFVAKYINIRMERKRINRLKVVLAEKVWYARELQQVLDYVQWENFVVAIGRAMESCKTLGINVDDHFRDLTKMIALAKSAQCEVQDFMLMQYAWCRQR